MLRRYALAPPASAFESVASSCEQDNEMSGSIKGEKFDLQSDYFLFKKSSSFMEL